MTILLLAQLGWANDYSEIVQSLGDDEPVVDDADRPRVVVASSPLIAGGPDRVAVRMKDGRLVVVEEHGAAYEVGDSIVSAPAVLIRSRDLLRESKANLVAWLVGKGESTRRISYLFRALLGPACPGGLCVADRVDFGAFEGFPLVPEASPRQLHYGDVVVSRRGDRVVLCLDPDHFLVVGDGDGPQLATRSDFDISVEELPWRRVISGPSLVAEDLRRDPARFIGATEEQGPDLSAQQVETLIAAGFGPGPVELEPSDLHAEISPGRAYDPRLGSFNLRLEAQMFVDEERLAAGPGAVMTLGVPVKLAAFAVPMLVLTPFIGFGGVYREFPATTDDRYEDLDPAPLVLLAGARLELLMPVGRGWWAPVLAPALRADGIDVLAGTAQGKNIELPLSIEYRRQHVGFGVGVGWERGTRTNGLAADDDGAWKVYNGLSLSGSITAYFFRQRP